MIPTSLMFTLTLSSQWLDTDALQLGQGFDSVRGTGMSRPCVKFAAPAVPTSGTSWLDVEQVTHARSLTSKFSLSLSASLSWGIFSAAGRHNTFSSKVVNSHTSSLFVSSGAETTTPMVAFELTDEAKQALDDGIASFLKICGDSFVSRVRYGGDFAFVIENTGTDATTIRKTETAFNVALGLNRTSANWGKLFAEKVANTQYRTKLVRNGPLSALPAIEDALNYAQAYPEKVFSGQPLVVAAELSSYEILGPSSNYNSAMLAIRRDFTGNIAEFAENIQQGDADLAWASRLADPKIVRVLEFSKEGTKTSQKSITEALEHNLKTSRSLEELARTCADSLAYPDIVASCGTATSMPIIYFGADLAAHHSTAVGKLLVTTTTLNVKKGGTDARVDFDWCTPGNAGSHRLDSPADNFEKGAIETFEVPVWGIYERDIKNFGFTIRMDGGGKYTKGDAKWRLGRIRIEYVLLDGKKKLLRDDQISHWIRPNIPLVRGTCG